MKRSKTQAERLLDLDQRLKILKDGRVEISFDAKGDVEIKRWVMAFGRHAKVKSPKWLKEQIMEEAKAMLK